MPEVRGEDSRLVSSDAEYGVRESDVRSTVRRIDQLAVGDQDEQARLMVDGEDRSQRPQTAIE